ncbi:hypothetical protein EAE96_006618 [Botrytis aclada]|nr:hypothetical protein EAE96_006618 [Botrytis aclada]
MESDLSSFGTMSIGAKEACLESGRELLTSSQLKFNVIRHLNGTRWDSSLEATSPQVEWSLAHVLLSCKVGLNIHNNLDHLVANIFLCYTVFAACSNGTSLSPIHIIYLGLLELSAIASAIQPQETGSFDSNKSYTIIHKETMSCSMGTSSGNFFKDFKARNHVRKLQKD